ncbi:hypothetical protein K469DRAFT_54551 [Zopfia rhizophila CBS 207.26]|uniref:Uncharacterized protein n=1 Tax=Zopfia rhizophila CBS 207.26 TaxID=1314779 RepID=A0A6A6D8F3_9PEZI|nr:hypothetical protein K469DRAFT_54551 [Zopfia rhizophila CBS 207.26]
MRLCSSFWLPLADMVFTISGTEVTIHWSDCNQMTAKGSGNYGQHYDWLYDPSRPNHSLTIRFHDFRDAQRFIDCVRFPHEDGITVRNGQNVEVSESEEVQIYDIGRKATIGKILDYRIAVVTRRENAVSYSKLIIRWPELDLDIQILERFAKVRDYLMQVKLDNVVTPTYHSSVRGEPAVDYNKVARFKTAHQLKSSLMVTFPIGRGQGLPVPPSGMHFFHQDRLDADTHLQVL